MNTDKMIDAGNKAFAAGCAMTLLFWIVLPALFIGVLLILSILGLLD